MNRTVNKWFVLGGFLAIIALLLLGWFRETKEDQLLNDDGVETIAFLVKNKPSSYRSGGTGDFYFKTGGKRYEVNVSGNFNFLETGDTILIVFAKKNPSIVRLKDKYYMKKYRRLKR